MSAIFKNPIFHCAAIAAICVMTYSNTLNNPFIFDDPTYVSENPAIRDFTYFANPSMAGALAEYNVREFFATRYAGFLSFALNYRIHGLDVRGYHIANLAIHIINSMLVYWLVLLTFRSPRFGVSNKDHAAIHALIIAMLFAAHPVNTQAVTYISQRFASLCAMFYLASIVFYVQSRLTETRTRFVHYALSLIFAVSAMKTKEIAFTLPIAVLMYEMMFFEGTLKTRITWLSLHLLTLLIIPLTLINRAKTAEEAFGMASKGAITSFDYLITQIRVIATYLRLLILPINQNLDYDYPIYKTIADPNVILSILLHAAIIALGVWMFVRSKDKPLLRFASFGIFWFYLTLSVESSVIPIKDVIFEHRVYLPSIGALVAMIMAASASIKQKRLLFMASVAIIAAMAIAAYVRNGVWQSETELWRDAAYKSPDKVRPVFNLANKYKDTGDRENAIKYYKRTLELDPQKIDAMINMGVVYYSTGRIDEAIGLYRTALIIDPKDPDALNNLGVAYFTKGRIDEAINQYNKTIEADAGYWAAYLNLGEAYLKIGKIDDAIDNIKTYLKNNPGNAEAMSMLADALRAKGMAVN